MTYLVKLVKQHEESVLSHMSTVVNAEAHCLRSDRIALVFSSLLLLLVHSAKTERTKGLNGSETTGKVLIRLRYNL
jgi:hypothetical protein